MYMVYVIFYLCVSWQKEIVSWPVWYKAKFGSQILTANFGVFL